MKKFVVLAVFALMGIMPMLAQNQQQGGGRRHFDPAEFKARMESFIRDRAGLSQAEAESVLPLFFEMKEKQMKMSYAIMNLKRECMMPNNDGKAKYEERITKIMNLEVESAKLGQRYYAKMCKLVDAKKVIGVMMADDAFHREMLMSVGGRGGYGQPGGFGPHRGGNNQRGGFGQPGK